MKQQIKSSLILLLTATIWGTAFVAQSSGMDYVGGFTFNCTRSIIGGIVLIPCIFLLRKLRGTEAENMSKAEAKETSMEGKSCGGKNCGHWKAWLEQNKTLIQGGVSCGIILCLATNLQQFGIKYTSVGKAGFITALYIVLVPILGLFLHKKVGKLVWIGLAFAVAGLYFLCLNEKLTIGKGDFLVFLCAAVFACHILVVDHFAPLVDCVAMSCIQFFTVGILSAIPMFLFEEVTWSNLAMGAGPILYAGALSSGVAYTLQMVGQKNLNPTVASMIMSLESVISVLAGLVILKQMLSGRELLGCVLMFVAVILSQLPEKSEKNKD